MQKYHLKLRKRKVVKKAAKVAPKSINKKSAKVEPEK